MFEVHDGYEAVRRSRIPGQVGVDGCQSEGSRGESRNLRAIGLAIAAITRALAASAWGNSVRFTPKSGYRRRVLACRLSADFVAKVGSFRCSDAISANTVGLDAGGTDAGYATRTLRDMQSLGRWRPGNQRRKPS